MKRWYVAVRGDKTAVLSKRPRGNGEVKYRLGPYTRVEAQRLREIINRRMGG